MLESLARLIGFGLCHQLPERSFFGGGVQVPVCARDTGVYVGFMVAFLVLLALGGKRRPSGLPPVPVAALCAVFVGAMALDGITSYAGVRSTTNDIRLLTGLLAGFAVAAYAVPLVSGTLLSGPGRARVLSTWGEIGVWLAAIPAAYGLVRWVMPLLGAGFPLAVTAAVLFAFTSVNLAIVGVFRPFEGSVQRFSDLAAPAAWAFGLTLVEVLGSAGVRAFLTKLAGV